MTEAVGSPSANASNARAEFITFAELAGRPLAGLGYVNVYVRLAGRPYFVDDSHGKRWQIDVTGLDGQDNGYISVHREPGRTGLQLGYTRTSPELLELFDRTELRSILAQGQVVLVQARVARGTLGIYLNVPTVLIVRPFRLFGRRQIDLNYGGDRRKYLSITKRTGGGDETSLMHAGRVGGFVVEDVFRKLSTNAGAGKTLPPASGDGHFVGDSLSDSTVAMLIILALTSGRGQIASALSKGADALKSYRDDPSVSVVIEEGDWVHESPALRNGVYISPDFLATAARRLLELKHVNPCGKNFNIGKWTWQVEASLAWAMVEYGVEEVAQNWTGYVLNLFPRLDGTDRLVKVPRNETAREGMRDWAAQRILNRHRLMTLADGTWLPRPQFGGCDNCNCDVSCGDADDAGLPPACHFYCQMERSWDCVASDGSNRCPLFSVCRQHDKFVDYERIDLFNTLREVLRDEEEEQSAAETVRETIAAGGAGQVMEGMIVRDCAASRLTLELPASLAPFEFARSRMRFEVLRNGRALGYVRFQRRREEGGTHLLQLLEQRPNSLRLARGEAVALRRTWEGSFPVREQMRQLDQMQRAGDEPLSLHLAGRANSTRVKVHYRQSLVDFGSTGAGVIVVDALGRAGVRNAAREILKEQSKGRILLITAGDTTPADVGLGEDMAADISAQATVDLFHAAKGNDAAARVNSVADLLRQRRVWVIPRAEFFDSEVGQFTLDAAQEKFDQIVVLDAEAFPLLGVSRCLKLAAAGKVILVGQALAGGPLAYSSRARSSELFQNTVRLLCDSAELVMPSLVTEVEVVRLPAPRACRGLRHVFNLGPRIEGEVAAHFHATPPGPTSLKASPAADLRLVVSVPMTQGMMKRWQVELTLEPPLQMSSRQIRALLKAVPPRAIEALDASTVHGTDRSLLGHRARVTHLEVRNDANADHELAVVIPASGFPWMQEHVLSNPAEVEAVLDFVAGSTATFHIISPFFAQCHLIAAGIAERQLGGRARVYTLSQLGGKPPMSGTQLIFCATAGWADPTFPYPLDEPDRLAQAFIGGYDEFHVFGSDDLKKYHPLIRALFDKRAGAEGADVSD